MHYAHRKFPNLKNVMVCADPYSIKPLKEVDQNLGCIDCMKICDPCKKFVDHISSFEYFVTKNV